MKNNITLVIKIAALAVLVIALGTCQTLSKVINEPSVSLDSVSITGINFTGIDMLAKITVKNNNPVSIPFPELNWNFFVANGSFLSGVIPKGTKIAARGSSSIDLPITVTYEGLYKAITALLNADEAAYRIDLAARFELPLLESKTFTASFSGSIPLIKMPSLSFSGVQFTSLNLTKVEFVLTWLVENKGGFAITIDKLDYNFAVNSTPWVSGSTQRASLPGRKVTQVPVTITINTLSVVKDIVTMAAGGKMEKYSCGGEAVLSLQGFENAAPLKFPFNYSGTTNLKL
jgi:LEA14-like dessication related protein